MAVKKRAKRASKKVGGKPGRKPAKKTTKKSTSGRGRKPGRKAKAKVGRKPGRKKKAGRPKKAVKKKARRISKTAKKPGRKRAKSRADAGSAVSTVKKPRKSKKLSAAATNRALERIKEFLTRNNINFELIKHSPAITAPHIAASAHIPGRDMAKTVIVKIDGRLAMVVESANSKVDIANLKRQLDTNAIELAHEAEFKPHFPDCETGAMPPLGNLYDMEVFVDENLSQNEAIAFNAGTHSELIKMAYDDFASLVNPKVIAA